MLSLGLVLAFSISAMALDVEFSGEFYAAGVYLDKTTVKKDTATDGPSTAFYYQRLRVRTDFTVSPGLTLVTRFDAMERAWGATRDAAGTALAADSAGTRAENENIALDWAYINYKSAVGVFDVGYMNDGATGTIFGNSYAPAGRIKYSYAVGPVTLNAAYTKVKEANRTAVNTTATTTDRDNDKYSIEGVYNWKTGRAGLDIKYYNYAENRTAAQPYKRNYFLLTPYILAKIGSVALQAEFNYLNGRDKFDNGAADITLDNIAGWVDATADLGKFYAGGTIAYVSGNDPGTTDKNEGGILNGGRDWSPCLIMWNYERTNWAGTLAGYDGAAQDTAMTNSWFFQARGGVKPIDALDIMASVSYANADKKPADYLNNAYGYEVDLKAIYKITNNLSYMLGVGYLFTDDYYKGKSDANNLRNDYLVINKLTLTF
ncbi:MAG: hypothetical protein CVU71_14700 [Deltaproteobacteria bacterium HGW-Deltaproteobacteria-6]|jgi:hypothetical protein|nr:MAG: hypothetical protein CVU71_14700 [Deltaproteobacteria bacterium HGW-Deltaproteobacteria-6]